MRNKPPYAIASVDSALLLAALLQQEGPLRVTDAAERLGVSVSTAHRLLAMLVYRDFAEQQEDRRYRAGRVLREAVAPEAPVARLRQVALPHLRDLVDRLGETVNVMVLAGSEVRFVATAECDHVLRVGDRTGRSLPAHLASGGKAILAALAPEDLAQVLGDIGEDLGEDEVVRLRKELNVVRRRGFAVNDQSTEAGLTAVGVAIPDPGGTLRAAISIAVPTVRYSRELLPIWTAALAGAATAVGTALARP
ncbi:MAG: transcriptional regulator, IclR family [Blastococcus sp.]|jgi:IclR family acetate operon transcriptional repressor|nr:transcriptional regulator, IclR family [Blastococcus sp.]